MISKTIPKIVDCVLFPSLLPWDQVSPLIIPIITQGVRSGIPKLFHAISPQTITSGPGHLSHRQCCPICNVSARHLCVDVFSRMCVQTSEFQNSGPPPPGWMSSKQPKRLKSFCQREDVDALPSVKSSPFLGNKLLYEDEATIENNPPPHIPESQSKLPFRRRAASAMSRIYAGAARLTLVLIQADLFISLFA